VTLKMSETSSILAKLRRYAGLSWQELADFFDVSNRDIFHWASGQELSPIESAHLTAVWVVVESADVGSAQENRTKLFQVQSNGETALSMLKRGAYADAIQCLGYSGFVRPVRPPLSPEEQERRRPLPPAVLLGALQDRPYPTSGKFISAKPLKRKS
jgi:hypothetical protein